MPDDSPDDAPPARRGLRRHVYRGSLLSTYLVLWFIVSLVGIATQWFARNSLAATTPPDVLLAVRAAIFIRPFCIVAIWFWSRTGVLALIVVSLLLAVLVTAEGFWIGVVGILAPVILIVLVRPIWRFMRWSCSRRSQAFSENDEEE